MIKGEGRIAVAAATVFVCLGGIARIAVRQGGRDALRRAGGVHRRGDVRRLADAHARR